MDKEEIEIPMYAVQAIVARLATEGITFAYGHKFSVDYIMVDRAHAAAVQRWVRALK